VGVRSQLVSDFSYFLKNSTPENLAEMIARFEHLTGEKCPFSFDQIIKFPKTALSRLS